ncbi:hypothetical protein M0802_012506 [Mischocyttarus mexicanus]|nr:hypothetical protein M0802_012506 [Mischocyttarus mexicanus]
MVVREIAEESWSRQEFYCEDLERIVEDSNASRVVEVTRSTIALLHPAAPFTQVSRVTTIFRPRRPRRL